MYHLLCTLSLSVLRTVAELNALPTVPKTNQVSFAITGEVLAVSEHANFSFRDTTGRTFIYNRTSGGQAMIPRAGERVAVQGTVITENDGFICFCANKLETFGCGTPAPLPSVSPADIASGRCDYLPVCVTARVTDAFNDEIDTKYRHLVLGSGAESVLVPLMTDAARSFLPEESPIEELLDAEVAVTGICRPRYRGQRIFHCPSLDVFGPNPIRILEPAPADRFSAPPLGNIRDLGPSAVAALGSRSVVGTVEAVWDGTHLMIMPDGLSIRRVFAILQAGKTLPPLGAHIKVVGLPTTDSFAITLTRAVWRAEPGEVPSAATDPARVTADTLLSDDFGHREIRATYHGQTVRLSGIVRSTTAQDCPQPRLHVEDGNHVITVNVSACPGCLKDLARGSEVEITGVCLLNAERWQNGARFPHVDGFTIVVRTERDIRVLKTPPWWTPGRLLSLLCLFVAAIIGILWWNRLLNRLVERRSRELVRERSAREQADLKLDERTRLAVELHDTIAQDLTGLALQFEAAEMAGAENPAAAMPYLKSAILKLKNCRTNLRDCIWDLRSRAFDEKRLADAIRRTVIPHLGNALLTVECDIPCHALSDNALHQILAAVRELVLNAVRHGRAAHVTVSGRLNDDRLDLEVADDGCGFDPSARPGADTGHFGLQGVAERVHRLEGTFEITSTPGRGVRATLTHLSTEI